MIPILGMHRSGTSALASAIYMLGADLGPEESWLQAAPDNPLGFFEYAPLVDLNRDILVALGGTWSSPPALRPGWIHDDRLIDLRELARELSDRMAKNMVVKDPRLSLLQPLWDDVGFEGPSLICLRNPVAVAASLQTRNGFTIDEGLFLWFRYNAAAVLNRPDSLLVEYESLLADPLLLLRQIADHIGLDASEKTLESASTTVYRSMAHHLGEPLPDTPVGELCRRLYEILQSGQPLATDLLVSTWAQVATELPWAGAGDRDIGRVRGETARLSGEVQRLADENRALKQRLSRLETQLRHAMDMVDVSAISETADLLKSLESESQ